MPPIYKVPRSREQINVSLPRRTDGHSAVPTKHVSAFAFVEPKNKKARERPHGLSPHSTRDSLQIGLRNRKQNRGPRHLPYDKGPVEEPRPKQSAMRLPNRPELHFPHISTSSSMPPKLPLSKKRRGKRASPSLFSASADSRGKGAGSLPYRQEPREASVGERDCMQQGQCVICSETKNETQNATLFTDPSRAILSR